MVSPSIFLKILFNFRYTAQQGTIGPVFGANDFWTGMGIMLDSFDNDGGKNNPSISLMINDGIF